MNVYLLDNNFETIDIIDDYSSIIWTPRYYDVGDFELYLAMNRDVFEKIKCCKYLVREKDIIGENEFHNVMIPKKINIKTNAESGDYIILSGKCLKSILGQRCIEEQTNLSGTVEGGIYNVLSDNIINPTNHARRINNFVYGTNVLDYDFSEQFELQVTGDNVGEWLSTICKQYGYGYDIYVKNKKFIFKLYKGTDRSYKQSINPYVVFSQEFDNLNSSDYTEDNSNFKNVAIVAGEGEGVERRKFTVGTATGLERYETFVDARDISSNKGEEDEINDDDYNKMLEERGNGSLTEFQKVKNFDANIEPSTNYVINEDYFLGDIVEVVNEYGIEATSRITEIIESEDENGSTTIPTFAELEV